MRAERGERLTVGGVRSVTALIGALVCPSRPEWCPIPLVVLHLQGTSCLRPIYDMWRQKGSTGRTMAHRESQVPYLVPILVTGLLLLMPTIGRAQVPTPANSSADALIRVFLDCERCDSDHLRQNVGFVDHVLDRAVADVHVLVTTQTTGGGGLSWRVQFIGTGSSEGQDLTLTFDTSSTATEDERREAFNRIFKLGLASRAAATRAAPQLNITWTAPAAASTAATRDPWRFWVFNMRASGNANGERSSSSVSHNLFVSANRTTTSLKASLSASGNTQKSRFELGDDETVTSRRHSWGVNGRVVKSLGPRWSAGVTGSVSHSSFSNLDRAASLAPAIEFNVFPYAQSSRRSLTLHYAAGVLAHRYTDVTIFDRLRETIPRHAAGATLNLQQPWGTLTVSSRVSQHLRNPELYRGSVWSVADVRLFKGFSFNVYAEYERIKDQISLRKAGVSDQEALLRLQQQATGYSYYLSFGINYRFGSIFNNVVNTRFDNSAF